MELLGQTLGSYRIDRLLEEGGTGDVYQAYDLTRQREVAIKLIHADIARQPTFRERFAPQMRAAAGLEHAGIVKVLDFGQHKDQLYVVMEYLRGVNLRKLLDELINKRKWLPLDQALLLIEELCQTVEYLHSQGVLFRDIDPRNLILRPELNDAKRPFQIVLTDLRLGELLEQPGMDPDGGKAGTPAYMSPEQALGKETDARSSVYSLGILLYELVVGLLPFQVRTVPEAILYHTKEIPAPPRSILPNLPEALERVILKALEKDPGQRYSNAAELGAALAGVMTASEALKNADTGHDVSLFAKESESLLAPAPIGEITVWEEAEADNTELQPAADSPSARIPPTISIEVNSKGEPPQLFTFPFATVIIGRGKENQIVLDNPKISRQHVRVSWDGTNYYVTDLKSSNGTYLEKTRLQPDVPQIWNPRQEVRIGGFSLRLISQASPHTVIEEPLGTVMQNAMEAREPVSVTPQQLAVEAGASVTATLSLFNQSPNADRFTLSLSGIPEDWVTNLPPQVELDSSEAKEIPLTLYIPRAPQARAGRHQIMIRVASQRDPGKLLAVRLTLTIAAYAEFRTELNPQHLRPEQAGNLTITNLGNVQETFQVIYADDLNELSFQPPQLQVRLKEGENATVEYRAQVRQLRLLGSEKTHPFSVQVSLPRGEPQILRADVVSRGLFPAWVPAIFIPFCCLLMAGLLFILAQASPLPFFGNPTSSVTPTVELTLTPSVTPEPGAPVVEEWCVYLKDQPPSTFTNCPVQVKAMPGQILNIRWRVSNATELSIDPIGSQPFSGEIPYEVTATTTQISLRANNAENKKNQKTTQIIVVLPTATLTPITPSPAPTTPVPTSATSSPLTTNITNQPSNPSTNKSATFNFVGTEGASFDCKLDTGNFEACTSPKTYNNLPEGPHTFQVRARDTAGNVDSTPAFWTWNIDTIGPTVTITQASGQADLTNASPINFTVVFSESVTGFTDIDVNRGGTAGATTSVVTGSGTTYNVAVSGMTGDGTVTASVSAGAVTDALGNTSSASTFTDNSVTYDKTGPTVTIDPPTTQAPADDSAIRFTVRFNENVIGFEGTDIDFTGSTNEDTLVARVLPGGGPMIFTVEVTGVGGSDMVKITIPADKVTDMAGNGNQASPQPPVSYP